jgi:tRNA (guanosine-2'-O-)-methyltransferase
VNDAIDKLIDRHGPYRICEALAPMLSADRIARIQSVLASRLTSVAAAVEDTYDPHNAAATIRTCESLGLQDLHVVEKSERFSASKGVTRGAHQWIQLHRWATASGAAAALHAQGFRVYATRPDASVSIEEVDVTTPLVVLFGNEHAGVSGTALSVCDGALAVPMFGFTESYNLSVTVALAMSRVAARRRAYIRSNGDLDEARRSHLRARWYALGIRSVEQVIERVLGS